MAGKKKRKVRAKDLEGFKYLKLLEPFLERLHKVGTERDVAGNRDLHFDQYTSLVLLYFFSPIVTSLRGLQQTTELKKVQKQRRSKVRKNLQKKQIKMKVIKLKKKKIKLHQRKKIINRKCFSNLNLYVADCWFRKSDS